MTASRRKRLANMHTRRAHFIAFSLAIITAAYVARVTQLQVVQGDRWQTRAVDQSEVRVVLPATRGRILDREGRPLALSREEFQVYYAPTEVANQDLSLAILTKTLGLSARQTARLKKGDRGWILLPRKVTSRERDELSRAMGSGIYFVSVPTRVYPEGRLARAILGTLDSEGAGSSGIEAKYDSLLRGRPGEVAQTRDARGATYRDPQVPLSPPVSGHDLYLTLDAELQTIAEIALDEAIDRTGASGGDVIIADPTTGELLAVASRRQGAGLRVPAFSDPFEPGSTVKPFLLAALLQEGEADLADKVYAEHGRWMMGSRLIEDVHEYDTLTVAQVLRYSSNIGAAKLSTRLEPGQQYSYLRDFGFGTPTGVVLTPESGGLLRRPEDWSGLSQASLAIGYELMVTSLQLVSAYGALANGGTLMKPRLIREIRGPDGESVYKLAETPVRRVIDRNVASQISQVLGSAVNGEGGTGTRAALRTVSIAGKTGTARIASAGGYSERYQSSFVGFAPVEDPALVILVKLEDPQGEYYGGQTAAPVSRAILQAALASNQPYAARVAAHSGPKRELAWGAPDAAPARAVLVNSRQVEAFSSQSEGPGAAFVHLPDLRGLAIRPASAHLFRLGLNVELEASGRVRRQVPAGGSRVIPGATVLLQ
ncbi:MAG: penicillin-binding transpeptidase domain-containing protein [Gemmatimonadota bacterium]